jgi:hypothetical protein
MFVTALLISASSAFAQVRPMELGPSLPTLQLSDPEDGPKPEMPGPELDIGQLPGTELEIVPVEDTEKIEKKRRDEAAIRESILERLRRGEVPPPKKKDEPHYWNRPQKSGGVPHYLNAAPEEGLNTLGQRFDRSAAELPAVELGEPLYSAPQPPAKPNSAWQRLLARLGRGNSPVAKTEPMPAMALPPQSVDGMRAELYSDLKSRGVEPIEIVFKSDVPNRWLSGPNVVSMRLRPDGSLSLAYFAAREAAQKLPWLSGKTLELTLWSEGGREQRTYRTGIPFQGPALAGEDAAWALRSLRGHPIDSYSQTSPAPFPGALALGRAIVVELDPAALAGMGLTLHRRSGADAASVAPRDYYFTNSWPIR